MEFNGSNEFGKINIDELNDFERANQITLPEDYRAFLIKYNGGVPLTNIVKLEYGAANLQILLHDGPYYANFWWHIDTFHNRIPSWYIPNGSDPGGNLFIMSLWEGNKGGVAFWDHEWEAPEGEADQYFDNMRMVADSFTDFINNLKSQDSYF